MACQASSGSKTVSGVTIADNEINDSDVRITATGTGTGAATVQSITIRGNEIAGGAIEVLADAQSSSITVVNNIIIEGNRIHGDTVGIEIGKQGSGTASLQNFTISGNDLEINNPSATGYAVSLADVGGESTFSNNSVAIIGTVGSSTVFDGIDIRAALQVNGP